MANRYIRNGATYNGDGTSSALATSNGGVGAWNTITYFEGVTPAYGTLPAGTNVFVRSKDESGSDITLSYAINKTLGQTAATELAPINWIIDDGSVWPGVSGVVTYNMTDRVALSVRDYNNLLVSPGRNLVFANTLSSVVDVGAVTFGKCITSNLKIDLSVCSNNAGPYVLYSTSMHHNLWARSNGRYQALFRPNGASQTLVLNAPKIELVSGSATYPVFIGDGGYGAEAVTVYGGEIFGAGAMGSAVVFASGNNAGSFRAFGLSYPREMPLSNMASMGAGDAFATGVDNGMGGEYASYYHAYDSRSDNNPPTLNAKLENSSNQPWSYKVYPYRTNPQKPALLSISKTYTQAAAAKTVTQEILWPTSLASPTKNQVYMSVQYVDASTGLKVYQSTQLATSESLDSSTAAWTAATWGAVSLTKFKLSITTATAIKTDTSVTVALSISPRAATSNDVIFVDPDVTLS